MNVLHPKEYRVLCNLEEKINSLEWWVLFPADNPGLIVLNNVIKELSERRVNISYDHDSGIRFVKKDKIDIYELLKIVKKYSPTEILDEDILSNTIILAETSNITATMTIIGKLNYDLYLLRRMRN